MHIYIYLLMFITDRNNTRSKLQSVQSLGNYKPQVIVKKKYIILGELLKITVKWLLKLD